MAVCWKHVHEPPLPPSKLNPRISPAIEQAVLRALAKDPHTRYTTALELAEAYHQALTLPATAIKDLPFLLAQTQPVSIEVKPMQASCSPGTDQPGPDLPTRCATSRTRWSYVRSLVVFEWS